MDRIIEMTVAIEYTKLILTLVENFDISEAKSKG